MTNKVIDFIDTVLCVLLTATAAAGLMLGGWAISHNAVECERYALAAVVVEIDRDSDIVICEDSNGNLWEFYGCEDWQEGDCASLLMNDQGTSNIYDDTIECARYNAWTLMH